MRTFSDEQYQTWRKRLGIILGKFGRAEDAEDAVNEFCLGALEGKHQHQTLDHFAIDYLRKTSGRKGSRGYHTRQQLNNGAQSIESEHVSYKLGVDTGRDVDARIDLERIRDLAKPGLARFVFQLYHVEGFTLKEIGDELGVSQSRVSQVLSKSELEVAKLTAKGLSNKETADKLFITEKTVKFHLTNIYGKTGVDSRSQLIVRFKDELEELEPKKTKEVFMDSENWGPLPAKTLSAVSPVTPARQANSQDSVTFIVETFKVDETIKDLQTMAKEVTKGDYTVEKVMAACQCVGRMNETIQTVMKATQVLNGRS